MASDVNAGTTRTIAIRQLATLGHTAFSQAPASPPNSFLYTELMPYSGPYDAIASVLSRLGIDPRSRFDRLDQDAEYTACRAAELDQYFELYSSSDLDANERAVLCCFLLEGLNELFQSGRQHPLHDHVLAALFDAYPAHADELKYWSDTSDPDEENWWPIAKSILRARAKAGLP